MVLQVFLKGAHKGYKRHIVPQLRRAWTVPKAFVQRMLVHPQVGCCPHASSPLLLLGRSTVSCMY